MAIPLRLAPRRPNTAVCQQAARTAAIFRREGRVTTALPSTAMHPFTQLGAPMHSTWPVWCVYLVTVPIGATPIVLGCLSVIFRFGRPVPPSGLSSLHSSCRCVGLSLPGHAVALGCCEMVSHVSVQLVGSWGRVVARPRSPRRACATPISMAAERPCTGGCGVARPPAPVCLWGGSCAG